MSSDVVRQTSPLVAAEDRYSDSAKAATYRDLLAGAERALKHGEHVVADATWGDPALRALAAHAANATASRLVALECAAPVDIAPARAQRRLVLGEDGSEADADVARNLAAARAPWPGAAVIDTSGSVEESLACAMAAVSGAHVPTGRDF